MTAIINLTPHGVNILGQDGHTVLVVPPPSGDVARVATIDQPMNGLVIDGATIPVSSPTMGDVVGLPAPQQGVVLLVSALVRAAVPGRADVVSPGPLVRGQDGQPIGCRGLSANPVWVGGQHGDSAPAESLQTGLSASHPNGRSGAQLLTPGGRKPPRGTTNDPLRKGTLVRLPRSAGHEVWALEPKGDRLVLAVAEDAELLTPQLGEVVLSYGEHSHGGHMALMYLDPGARIRTYGYKRRDCTTYLLEPSGVLRRMDEGEESLARILETSSNDEGPEETPMQAALRAAGLLP